MTRVRGECLYDERRGEGPVLFVGGAFQSAGDVAASNIARWDGRAWSRLGDGINGTVYSMVIFDEGNGPTLFVGGEFSSAGGVQAFSLAKWDGVRTCGI